MKKVKKLLKIPALAALCFGLVLPVSSLAESGDNVNAERGGSVAAVRGGENGNAGNYAFDGADLELAGGDALDSGLTTSADWRYDASELGNGHGDTSYSLFADSYGAETYQAGLYDLTGEVADDANAVAYVTAFAPDESNT